MEPKPGLNRFVWDLTHDGATVITGAAVDSGGAGARIPVAPGVYTVRLKIGPLTLDQKLEVKPDPRVMIPKGSAAVRVYIAGPSGGMPVVEMVSDEGKKTENSSLGFRLPTPDWYRLVPGGYGTIVKPSELADQEQLSLRVRDDISKLSDTVARLRAVKKQIALREELLKDRDDAKDLLKESEALDKSLNEVEEKLHNPKAKISYDIFAAKGGAMLYSQFAWLLSNLVDADGAPTKAQMELADDLQKQLAELVSRFEGVAKDKIAHLNEAAKKLSVPELYVPPPAKKKDEAKTDEKK